MKIKDFAKVSNLGSKLEVVIIEEYKAWGCGASYEVQERCENEEKGCYAYGEEEYDGIAECEYFSYKERHKRLYEGNADDIPLRLSDKTIKRIEFKHECQNAYSKKCSYNVYLYIFVKGEDWPK